MNHKNITEKYVFIFSPVPCIWNQFKVKSTGGADEYNNNGKKLRCQFYY